MTHPRKLAVSVGGGEQVLSVKGTDRTTHVFVGPNAAATAHQLIARVASEGLTFAPSVKKYCYHQHQNNMLD
jgi:hypothetical protein